MEKWHSVLLITITIIVFGAAFYYDQINKNTLVGYDESLIEEFSKTQKFEDKEVLTSPSEKNSAWAEKLYILELLSEKNSHIAFHKEAFLGEIFIKTLIPALEKNKTTKEIIFSPFEGLETNQKDILQSLFNLELAKNNPHQAYLKVRGHSLKAASLLGELIIKTYKLMLSEEDFNNPILPKLIELKSKISILEDDQFKFSKNLSETESDPENISIEEIAISSELAQVSSEIDALVLVLRKIENIHQQKKSSESYLTIHSLASYGRVEEILSHIDQLQRMITNQQLETVLKNEVTKNLKSLKESLNQELAQGIDKLKEDFKNFLSRQKLLNSRLVELRIKEDEKKFTNPKLKLLKAHNKRIQDAKLEYEKISNNWNQAKENIVFQN